MRRLFICLTMALSACSPAIQDRTPAAAGLEDSVLAAPIVETITPCPMGETAVSDGIGGTGCK